MNVPAHITSAPENPVEEGATVTLTVAPETGYRLKEGTLKAADASGNLEVSGSGNVYTFTMGTSDVTVSAEFERIPERPNKIETLPAVPTEGGRVESDKTEAVEGEKVKLTVTPNLEKGYVLKELTVKDSNGKDVPFMSINDTTYASSEYSFDMPDSDVTVSVEFEVGKQEITVTYAPGEGSGESKTKIERLPFELPHNQGFTPPANKYFNGWTLPNGEFYNIGTQISELDDGAIITAHYEELGGGGCYVATAVYGSYDCPEVWTLRRFRDHVLAKTWYGRLFIKLYYAVSPTAVKLFGDADWFQNFWRGKLDNMVSNLQADGFESTPYQDMDW